MKQKLSALFLCAALVLSAVAPAFGLDKSIQPISSGTTIDNAGPSAEIIYEGESARVYYGSGGITIISAEKQVHLDTNFKVNKLVPAGDVDGDGYTDFFTFQNAPNYTEQLMTVSGKDGSIISALSLTRQGYDSSSTGYVQTNSYIQQLLAAEDGNIIVLYDYSIVKIDPKTSEILWKTDFDNNLWKVTGIGDLNSDGSEDFAFTGQSNLVAIVSGADGSVMNEYHPCEDMTLTAPWNDGIKVNAVFNMWDIFFDGSMIYATSEDGRIFTIAPDVKDPNSAPAETSLGDTAVNSTEIGVYSIEELLNMMLNYNIEYRGVGYSYSETGVVNWPYMGYRFADYRDGYLLINCYMGASDGAYEYADSSWPAAAVLFNTLTGEIENTIVMNYSESMYQKNCFIDYEGTPCIAVVNSIRDKAVSIAYYDYSGAIIYQREAALNIVEPASKFELSEDNGRLRIEVFGSGCAVFSEDLKTTEYPYDKVSSAVLSASDEGVYVAYSVNGNKTAVSKFSKDMSSEIWSFSAPEDFKNKGIQFVRTDRDWDKDGTNDVLAIVNSLNEEGNPEASHYMILSGVDGSELLNTVIKTDEYWDYEHGKLVTTYLTSETIDTTYDLDYDEKPELLCGQSVVSTRWLNVIGNLYGGVDAEGQQLQVGDINNDGATDYIVISDTETRIYQSVIGYSWGYVELNYVKTNTAFANDKTLEPMYTSGLIGDINADGVEELVMLGRNEGGLQIFKVYNGATLEFMYDLCSYGLNDDGESFAVLDTDFNGDGYFEIYGRDNWRYGIYDGLTGTLLFDTSGDDYYGGGGVIVFDTVFAPAMPDSSDGLYDSGYHPDYNVAFYKLDEKPVFVVLKDSNGDGNPEIASLTTHWDDETGEMIANLKVTAGGTFEEISSIRINNENALGTLTNIDNSSKYVAIAADQKLSIVDTELQKLLATFDIKINSAMQLDEDSVAVSAADGNLYKLDLEKSFELLTEIPETTDDYTFKIAWKSLQPLSVMTITDNNTVIYRGSAEEYDIKLVSGKHDLVFSMNDGQGKSYSESYTTEVSPQSANFIWVAVVFAVVLILALLFGILRKARISGRIRRAAK